ncbi:MAG: hypothetical protein JW809_04380 [Pirellulales bacterium]|nr:hypothetical protein [Pirellulales bacterium]
MSRQLKRLVWLGAALGVLLLAVAAGLYWASQQAPPWYRQAASKPHDPRQRQASEEMEQRVADLVSGLKTTGRWEVVITQEQVNAWLAVGLVEKHPGAIPPEFHDPRVLIEPDGVTLACGTSRSGVAVVVSLKVDVYLAEPNVVAMRIRRVRAGRLPWPLDQVLDGIARAAGEMDFPLRWNTTDGDPVGLIAIRPVDGKKVEITALQLDQGRLYVAGTTR